MDNVYNAMPYYENVYNTYSGGKRHGHGHRSDRRSHHSRDGPIVEDVSDAFASSPAPFGRLGGTVEEPDD
jgi:hypothetical protein